MSVLIETAALASLLVPPQVKFAGRPCLVCCQTIAPWLVAGKCLLAVRVGVVGQHGTSADFSTFHYGRDIVRSSTFRISTSTLWPNFRGVG